MKTKIISILALLLTVTQGAWAASQPTGKVDICQPMNGSIRVKGWAYDDDSFSSSLTIHIYMDGTYTESVTANVPSTVSGIENHYFDTYIPASAGSHTIKVRAMDLSGDGNPLLPGSSISGFEGKYEFTVTVLAPYSVTYNANGGTGEPSTQYKRTGFNLTLSSTQPTRDGYIFAGWNTEADGKGTSYAAGATYSADADVTLYAQWTCNTTTSGIDWNPSTKSGTFLMPAYNVEVSTKLWYKVNEEKTLTENIEAYGTQSDFFLNRTLTANVWNTFASPFAIAAGDMEKYFGAGAKVRQLGSTTVVGNVLTLDFTVATEIEAGKPYLVKPAVNVDFSADGKEFAGVDFSDATPTATTTTFADFVPTLGKTEVTGSKEDILFLGAGNKLYNPTSLPGNMKGFRAYFQLKDGNTGGINAKSRSFRIDFGDGEQTTGILSVEGENSETEDGTVYDLLGRRLNGLPAAKGVYIVKGKKVVK